MWYSSLCFRIFDRFSLPLSYFSCCNVVWLGWCALESWKGVILDSQNGWWCSFMTISQSSHPMSNWCQQSFNKVLFSKRPLRTCRTSSSHWCRGRYFGFACFTIWSWVNFDSSSLFITWIYVVNKIFFSVTCPFFRELVLPISSIVGCMMSQMVISVQLMFWEANNDSTVFAF